MSINSFDYGDLKAAAKSADKAAKKCESYVSKIEKKVTNKLSQLEGGGSALTNSASAQAAEKIRTLQNKQGGYERLADKISALRTKAKDTDENVSRYIKTESRAFRKTHNMEVNVLVEWFAGLANYLVNGTALGRWLKDKLTGVGNWIDLAKRKFREWYELDGGKYILKLVAEAIGVVIAVIVLVFVAWPALVAAVGGLAGVLGAIFAGGSMAGLGAAIWTVITAGAGFITAVFAVVNGVTKIATNAAALSVNGEDPGWASRYGSYSSLADYLQKTVFGSEAANKLSLVTSNILNFTENTAAVINIVDIARNGIKFCASIKEKGVWKVFDKVHFKSPNGKVTWGTFKYGLKKLFSNMKTFTSGVNNTNISRINTYMKSLNSVKGPMTINKILGWVKKPLDIVIGYGDSGGGGGHSFGKGILKKSQEYVSPYDFGKKSYDGYKAIKKTVQNWNYARPATAGG